MTLVEWPVRHLAGLDLLSLRLSHSFPPQTHTFTTTIYYLCLPQRYLSLSCVNVINLCCCKEAFRASCKSSAATYSFAVSTPLRVLYYRLSEPQAQQLVTIPPE